MSEEKQLIKYKKSFFSKIKEKFISFFRKKNNNYMDSNKKEISENILNKSTFIQNQVKESTEKEKFMNLYNKVKKGEIDTESLDEETLHKIIVLLNEEIELTNSKIYEEIKETKEEMNEYNRQLNLKKHNN